MKGGGASIAFEVPGRPPSGNRAARFGPRLYTPKNVKEYRERVRSLATGAKASAGFFLGAPAFEKARVQIDVFNCRLDVDNCASEILDGLQGVAFENDGHVIELRVRKLKDPGREPYASIIVSEFGA